LASIVPQPFRIEQGFLSSKIHFIIVLGLSDILLFGDSFSKSGIGGRVFNVSFILGWLLAEVGEGLLEVGEGMMVFLALFGVV
jgi:hypothetical protein